MKQINFRVSEEEYQFAENLAKILGKTVPNIVKDFGLKAMREASIDLALTLYKDNKIGLKHAWMMTGLAFHEFVNLLMARGIEPPSDSALVDRALESVQATRFEDLFSGKDRDALRKFIKVPEEST